jgi:hypothetical protein
MIRFICFALLGNQADVISLDRFGKDLSLLCRNSDLNYKIVDKKGKEFVVHIYRLKKSYDQTPWSFENARRSRQKTRQLDTETLDGNVEIQSRPIATGDEREPQVVETQALNEKQLQLEQDPQVPGNVETPDANKNTRQTPDSSMQDPDYEPLDSPRSR